MDEHGSAPVPVAVYGAVLLLCAVSWRIMQAALVRTQGLGSPLRAAIRGDVKGGALILIYAVAIELAFVATVVTYACYAAIAA